MLRLELIEVTEANVKYRYYPEDSKNTVLLFLEKTTREREILKKSGWITVQAMQIHALRRLEEYYCEKNTFPKRRYSRSCVK